jgi:hypothetical protein
LRQAAFDEDARATDLLQEYEARSTALERMAGRQALEIEFLKEALKNAPRPRSAITSVITGRVVLPSPKDAVVPLASIDRWQGRSTAGPFHYRTQRDPL